MKTFLGISKPSEAISAMVSGLREQSKRPDFVIDMSTFGAHGYPLEPGKVEKVCFGCAATCTLQKLVNRNFSGKDISSECFRSLALDVEILELRKFESAMDSFRNGNPHRLAVFFYGDTYYRQHPDLHTYFCGDEFPEFCLESEDWEEQLPIVESIVARLASTGY